MTSKNHSQYEKNSHIANGFWMGCFSGERSLAHVQGHERMQGDGITARLRKGGSPGG